MDPLRGRVARSNAPILPSALPLAFPGQPAAASDRGFPGDDEGVRHGQPDVTLWNSGLEQMRA